MVGICERARGDAPEAPPPACECAPPCNRYPRHMAAGQGQGPPRGYFVRNRPASQPASQPPSNKSEKGVRPNAESFPSPLAASLASGRKKKVSFHTHQKQYDAREKDRKTKLLPRTAPRKARLRRPSFPSGTFKYVQVII